MGVFRRVILGGTRQKRYKPSLDNYLSVENLLSKFYQMTHITRHIPTLSQ